MKQFDAEILENRSWSEDASALDLRWPEGLRAPLPGQFVTLSQPTFASVWRRTLFVAGYDRARRAATVLLSGDKPAGTTVNVVGPRGFTFSGGTGRPLLVAGGGAFGAAVFAANRLAADGKAPQLVLEAPDAVLGLLHADVTVVPWNAIVPDTGFVWATGPFSRLREIRAWAVENGLACQVLVESPMACAVGACLGCVVPVADDRKYLRACTEGPVFPAEVISWT